MGVLSNGHRDTSLVCKSYGLTALNNGYLGVMPRNFLRSGAMRNVGAGLGITEDKAAIPSGYRHPTAWVMPQKAGGIASRNLIDGAGAVADLNLAGGVNGAVTITGAGTLSGAAALVVSLVALIVGSGTITNASLLAYLQLAADLAGEGDLDGSLGALANAFALLSGDGTAAGSTATALGTLASEITVTGTGLSTSNVGQAVWAAIATANNDAGTMGEKLNDAGSASNPWTEVIESGLTAAEILRIIAAFAAGDAQGLEGSSPTFKSLDGSKDRITATYNSGTRTVTDLDGT